jgi:hypothetical protein
MCCSVCSKPKSSLVAALTLENGKIICGDCIVDKLLNELERLEFTLPESQEKDISKALLNIIEIGESSDNIKEFVKRGGLYTCSVRSPTRVQTLSNLLTLAKEVFADFPEIKVKDIYVVKYGGTNYKGTYGLEFYMDKEPEGYSEVDDLELIL